MDDAWEFLDPVDVLPQLPKNFEELITSKKWQERKEALEALLKLTTDNKRLDPKANYNDIVSTLSKILGKDANINVCAIAAKCITQLAKGLRIKFGPHAGMIVPIIFEKFKEKKVILRDPLVEAIDAVYATTNVDTIADEIAVALGKPNPNVKIQTNLFLYRIFKTFNLQTAPKKVVKALTPLIVKCTGESDPEAREAAFSALGAIMKAIGKPNAMTMMGDISGDKAKMTQIEKFYDKAVEEANAAAAEAVASAQATTSSSNTASNGATTAEASTASKLAPAAAAGPVSAPAVIEPDPWEFLDPVDVLPKLPDNFEELIASKKWQERKEALEALLQLTVDNPRLDPKANYNEILSTLSKILGKDANIHVCATAAKCITQLAKGLRIKFGPHAGMIVPIIFEKFKEKKVILRDPLVEAIDAVYATTNVDTIADEIAVALGKPNPNVKIQTNLFLYRVFKTFNLQTAPKKVVKALTPLIVKCTGESDPEAREAAFSALGAIMKAIGKPNALTMMGDISGDKAKMTQIEKFHDQAVQESGVEVVSEMVQSIHKSSPAESEKPADKVVRPKPKVAAARDSGDENEEPLKPIGKSDEESKPQQAANKNRRSVAPPPPPKSPEPAESSGVLSALSNRNQRMKDEKNLKSLKWNFKTPTEEHIQQLLTQFNEVGKPEFVKSMFSKDFKTHLKALDQIANQLQTEPMAIINNCDLILKWATFRFFDTNPQSLNKTLEVVLAMLVEMENQSVKLNDSDVTSFIPFLLLKSGDTKDIVRNLVRKIVSQTSVVSVPAKIFPLILDALNTKNSRQKAECLTLAESFLEYFGLNVCTNPTQSIKTIAACIAERDSNARNAALNCIGAVWRKVGDRVYQMIGTINPKEKAMLDERIKRMGREAPCTNDEPTLRLTPKDNNVTAVIPQPQQYDDTTPRSTVRSRSSSRPRQLDRTITMNSSMTNVADTTICNCGSASNSRAPSRGPIKMRFSLSSKHLAPLPTVKFSPLNPIDFGIRPVEISPSISNMTLHARATSTPTPRKSESLNSIASVDVQADQIDKTVLSLSSTNLNVVIEATNQLVFLFRDQENYSVFMIEKADLIAKMCSTQMAIARTQHLQNRELDEETNMLMRSLCNFLTFFMHQKPAVQRITQSTVKLFMSELLRFLCDEKNAYLKDNQHIVRSVNVITVKLCENSDINESMTAALNLLDAFMASEAPPKYVELLLKCLFKQCENFSCGNLQVDRFMIILDTMFLKHYVKNSTGIAKRIIDALRLTTQRFANYYWADVESYMSLVNPTGYFFGYLNMCVNKLRTNEGAPINTKSLQEMVVNIPDTIAATGLNELYVYLEAHPEEEPLFRELVAGGPIPNTVEYCLEEFRSCRDARKPKSFHEIYQEFHAEAGNGIPVSARSNGFTIPSLSHVNLPFELSAPSSTSSIALSTPMVPGTARPASPNFSPIPPQQVMDYKKRLSSLRMNMA